MLSFKQEACSAEHSSPWDQYGPYPPGLPEGLRRWLFPQNWVEWGWGPSKVEHWYVGKCCYGKPEFLLGLSCFFDIFIVLWRANLLWLLREQARNWKTMSSRPVLAIMPDGWPWASCPLPDLGRRQGKTTSKYLAKKIAPSNCQESYWLESIKKIMFGQPPRVVVYNMGSYILFFKV